MNKSKEVLYKTITMMLTINGGREGGRIQKQGGI